LGESFLPLFPLSEVRKVPRATEKDLTPSTGVMEVEEPYSRPFVFDFPVTAAQIRDVTPGDVLEIKLKVEIESTRLNKSREGAQGSIGFYVLLSDIYPERENEFEKLADDVDSDESYGGTA
jgi:hypothetical protein